MQCSPNWQLRPPVKGSPQSGLRRRTLQPWSKQTKFARWRSGRADLFDVFGPWSGYSVLRGFELCVPGSPEPGIARNRAMACAKNRCPREFFDNWLLINIFDINNLWTGPWLQRESVLVQQSTRYKAGSTGRGVNGHNLL